MIDIQNLVKVYNGITALKGINLNVREGEIFAYLGPNGSGKTTTIKILTGLARPTSGKINLNGLDIEKAPIEAKFHCGYVPQTINLDAELTVYENLDIHGRLFSMERLRRKEKIDELLAYAGIAERRDSLVKELSGGMKRRVMVVRALMHEPKILFLDEPTVGLDPAIRRKIWALIKRINKDGTTVFLTTHYIEEAEFLADRVAFLDEGRIVTIDTPLNLISDLGIWAIDEIDNDRIRTFYFKSQDDARRHVAKYGGELTLRRVNLEDAFIALTGKKVKRQ
ncbi:MAG: ABC transporter ATP-binding protein [Dissulfurimicrobium sp.]|uniref:ABC transporter ATP-binding protein n=1 Tax=Dissulfurimicrobium TaxID=1769732 RepID=UPI001EDAD7F5|nr:ATP-binding cassette domain-containing protein [Dissulfurimicrobium hydrothermale]UKL13975.1 ATP-binding cassette domain-containing protein [Dissulfurimicrobium hydrothermale]